MKPFIKRALYLGIGVGAGYMSADLLSGSAPGLPGLAPSFRMHIASLGVHLHHWMWATAGAATMFVVDRKHRTVFRSQLSYMVIGIFLGVAMQGFTYYDWSHVFYLR